MKFIRRLALTLTMLTALCLVAAPDTYSQGLDLNSGDSVTVDSTGTKGTINNSPVSNTTTSYNDSSGANADSKSAAVETSGTANFSLGAGGTLTNTAAGGSGLYADGSGTITITGGTITSSGKGASAVSDYGSVITITGGEFSIPTGSGAVADLNDSSGTINIYGTFLSYAAGSTTKLGSTGSFTGTLSNNTASTSYTYLNSGTLTLHDTRTAAAAPEPSEWAAMAFTALGIGGLLIRARRRVKVA